MLVIARKPGQVIRLGDEIQVTVLSGTDGRITLGSDLPASMTIQLGEAIQLAVVSSGHGQVRLGIAAPEHVRIVRGEIANRVRPAAD